MAPSYRLEKTDTEVDQLPSADGDATVAHVWQRETILAIEAALATGRALLLRGEPGTGKTQLAAAAAHALGGALVSHTVDSRTEPRDLKWTLDVVERLAEAQVAGSMPNADAAAVRKALDPKRFVSPGPLWWAFDPAGARTQAKAARLSKESWTIPDDGSADNGVVLLVDEIDKADPSVPNGLLDALGSGSFDVAVPGCGRVSRSVDRLLMVVTTNEERALPDAFLRRCVVLGLAQPNLHGLVERGRAHFSKADPDVLTEAATQVLADREQVQADGLSAPGLAEYLDLVRAVTELRPGAAAAQLALLEEIKPFFLRKHPEHPS